MKIFTKTLTLIAAFSMSAFTLSAGWLLSRKSNNLPHPSPANTNTAKYAAFASIFQDLDANSERLYLTFQLTQGRLALLERQASMFAFHPKTPDTVALIKENANKSSSALSNASDAYWACKADAGCSEMVITRWGCLRVS